MIRAVTYFGLLVQWHGRHLLRRFARTLRGPVLYLFSWVYILFAALDFFFARSARNFRAEWKFLRMEMHSVSDNLHRAWKKSTATWLSVFGHYMVKAFRRHRRLFKAAVNTALPVLMAVVLLLEIHQWQSFTYALRVIYDGETIGYIANESVYLQARNLAVEKLSVGMDENERAEVLDAPKYELSLVSINKMVDTSMLSDNLIRASDANITNACGVFIDGEFLCAVKNENDARSVFNTILEPLNTETGATAGFLETVDYVQGLYPDNENTMWDAQKLEQKLTGDKRPAQYYTAQAGDSFSKIASDNHLTISELKALNPELGDTILVGSKLLVAKASRYVTPKIVRTEVRTEEIDFKTETSYNSKLFSGDRRIVRQGQKGLDKVTIRITTVDGVAYDWEEIDRVAVREAVNEKVEVGTAKTGSAGYYGGSYSARGFMWPAPTPRQFSSRSIP